MTTKEMQKRNERSQDLRVLKSNGNFFVESAEGMVLYKVDQEGEGKYLCTCGDYARGIKNDANFQCKSWVPNNLQPKEGVFSRML